MKKIIALLLCVVLCASLLAACQDNAGTTGPAANSKPSSTPSTPSSKPSAPETNPSTSPSAPQPPEITYITIAQALEIAAGATDGPTTERYYIRATIKNVTNATYGAMILMDETGEIEVYRTENEDGSVLYADMEEKPYKGDEVVVHATLQNYNGKMEIQNAHLISFRHVEPEIDETAYTEMTIAQAREAAEGAKVKVSGVVARITYANGFKPAGLYLVDGTNSIYVYDADLAQRVKEGNRITVLASKTYWILDTEQNNAAIFGYKGCCQLDNAVLKENDEKTDNEFDKSWITESTVKDILDTPVSENITTTIFKVNALVSKQQGTGFVNYYFYDLDGKTGSYAYTQCNGGDFAWLDEFDGKICTVYLSAINAKSTNADCFFRLLPIAVYDEGFVFDTNKTAEHVVNYYGIGQFGNKYTGDPNLELTTSVSSTLLGFEDARLTYTSSDLKVIKFTEEDGKLVMHTVNSGTATVTVTGFFGGVEFSKTVEITVDVAQDIESNTIEEVKHMDSNTLVTVKGIVGPSLVNKVGFYLFDGTGMIAIQLSGDEMADLKIGYEVILQGTFWRSGEGTTKQKMQTYITDCEILSNFYGKHEYDISHIVTDKTVTDLYNAPVTEDHTATLYKMTGTITVERSQYYNNIFLSDGTNKLRLYCNNPLKDYEWLLQFEGQTVTVEIVGTNWNDKNYYTGCVLAVYTEDGKLLNELNFSK